MDKQALMDSLRSVLPELLMTEYGIDLAQIPTTLSRIDSLTASQTEQMWKKVIGLEGEQYTQAAKGIEEYFNKLPEATQAALDNEEGLKFIWSQVQAQMGQVQEAANQSMPQVDTGEVPQTSTAPQISYDPYKTWTSAEIDALAAQGLLEDPKIESLITQAYNEGRVN